MSIKITRKKGAISPAITNLILLAAVIGIGIFLWWFALSRSNISSQIYAEEVGSEIEKLEERFVVEHVRFTHTDSTDSIDIWIFNYGKIDVNIELIYGESKLVWSGGEIIQIGELVQIPLQVNTTNWGSNFETGILSSVSKGETVIPVASANIFHIGDDITLIGGSGIEYAKVKEVGINQITLESPIQYPYQNSDKVRHYINFIQLTSERGTTIIGDT